jgi:SAM-dependent methyltransferase
VETQKAPRPFYSEFAWAFDLLIDRPVERECATIAAWLVERGAVPGSSLLDAGCGTGRYAMELGRRGYIVHGIDMSPDLLDEARRSIGDRAPHVSFELGDLLTLPRSRRDAVLCRGVLNDLVDGTERQSAFASFAGVLREGGVLVLDIREWEATAARKAREPLFRKRVDTDRGRLTFTSVTELDVPNHQLIVRESHVLETRGRERYSEYEFVMRCWTPEELHSLLDRNGFGSVSYFGAYDPAVAPDATDRLVAVAQLLEKSA